MATKVLDSWALIAFSKTNRRRTRKNCWRRRRRKAQAPVESVNWAVTNTVREFAGSRRQQARATPRCPLTSWAWATPHARPTAAIYKAKQKYTPIFRAALAKIKRRTSNRRSGVEASGKIRINWLK
jgi:hypothetical protein